MRTQEGPVLKKRCPAMFFLSDAQQQVLGHPSSRSAVEESELTEHGKRRNVDRQHGKRTAKMHSRDTRDTRD